MLNLWVTTDKSNSINAWDISNETLEFRIQSPRIKNTIIDIVEMIALKLVAIGITQISVLFSLKLRWIDK